MTQTRENFLVGLVSIIATVAVAGLLIRFGELEHLLRATYPISVRTDTAIGIRRGSTVSLNGVPVGKVDTVTLRRDGTFPVLITASIDEHQPIPESEMLFNILAPGVMEDHFTFGFTRQFGQSRGLNFSLMYAPEVKVTGPNMLEVPGLQDITLAMSQWDIEVSYSWGF